MEFSASANVYQGKLLGLMTAHLILHGIAELHPTLGCKVTMYSDCAGALDKLANLPSQCFHAKCKHSDILKNILLNCSNLPFAIALTHTPTHQDDMMDFCLLSCTAQLTCVVDARAKKCLMEAAAQGSVQWFLLKPIACFVGKKKMTADTSASIILGTLKASKRSFCR